MSTNTGNIAITEEQNRALFVESFSFILLSHWCLEELKDKLLGKSMSVRMMMPKPNNRLKAGKQAKIPAPSCEPKICKMSIPLKNNPI